MVKGAGVGCRGEGGGGGGKDPGRVGGRSWRGVWTGGSILYLAHFYPLFIEEDFNAVAPSSTFPAGAFCFDKN